jgi:hypothetical protein
MCDRPRAQTRDRSRRHCCIKRSAYPTWSTCLLRSPSAGLQMPGLSWFSHVSKDRAPRFGGRRGRPSPQCNSAGSTPAEGTTAEGTSSEQPWSEVAGQLAPLLPLVPDSCQIGGHCCIKRSAYPTWSTCLLRSPSAGLQMPGLSWFSHVSKGRAPRFGGRRGRPSPQCNSAGGLTGRQRGFDRREPEPGGLGG